MLAISSPKRIVMNRGGGGNQRIGEVDSVTGAISAKILARLFGNPVVHNQTADTIENRFNSAVIPRRGSVPNFR